MNWKLAKLSRKAVKRNSCEGTAPVTGAMMSMQPRNSTTWAAGERGREPAP
jgi:hypothetical protein